MTGDDLVRFTDFPKPYNPMTSTTEAQTSFLKSRNRFKVVLLWCLLSVIHPWLCSWLLQSIQGLKVWVRGIAIGRRGAWVADLARQEAPNKAPEEWSHGVRLVLQKVHDSSHAHAEESHLQRLPRYYFSDIQVWHMLSWLIQDAVKLHKKMKGFQRENI